VPIPHVERASLRSSREALAASLVEYLAVRADHEPAQLAITRESLRGGERNRADARELAADVARIGRRMPRGGGVVHRQGDARRRTPTFPVRSDECRADIDESVVTPLRERARRLRTTLLVWWGREVDRVENRRDAVGLDVTDDRSQASDRRGD